MKITGSIKPKMIAVSLSLLIIPLVLLGIFSYKNSKESLNDLGKTSLTNSVESTLEMIEVLNDEVEKGNLSLEEAQEKVKVSVLGEKDAEGKRPINKKIDLGEHGYIFILDDEGKQIAHPVLEGENSWDTTDPNGVKSTQENIRKANDGGGFTYFSWPLPENENKIAPKVAYAKKDSHWGWNIVAGTYLMDFNKPAKSILAIIITVSSVAIIIGIVIIWLFANRLSNPLIQVADRMDKLSKGDLSFKELQVTSQDEIGLLATSMNRLQADLKKVITEIKSASHIINKQSTGLSHSASEVKLGAEQISTTMQELAIASENEANSASDLSSIMNDLSEQIKDANDGGEYIRSASSNMINISDKGSSLMNQSTEQMNKIHHIVYNAANKMDELDQQAQDISELVAVIHEIAEQTNLLALNAAIEAARAGEHGQGFSVVADEVRKLAEQSSASVKSITAIVTNIQNETKLAAASLEEGYQEVTSGNVQINSTNEIFADMKESISQMAANIDRVSDNLSVINKHSEQVNQKIEDIAAITEESAAGIEETTASSEQTSASMEEITGTTEDLRKLADQLNHLVDKFKI